MKKIFTLSLMSLLVFISGCLTYERMTMRIVFDNPGNELSGKIYVTTIGVASTADSLAKRQKDFDDILEFLLEDDFLLEEMKDGIYVKNRSLLKENNKLVFKYDGIFDELSFDDDFELKMINDELVAILDDDDIIENSNGRIETDSTHTYIKWPRSTKEIYWEYKMEESGETYSLLPFYEEWLKNRK